MKLFKNPMLLLWLLLLGACKQEYTAKIKPTETAVLVVEGVINSGNGPTDIHLSRTIQLTDTTKVQGETGATVAVESAAGERFDLNDAANTGVYSAPQLSLDPAQTYRLSIVTADGSQYASDYVPVLTNPPIDSVNWTRDTSGVQVFVSTHNPQNTTRYYRWEANETWEIHSGYFADKPVNDGILEPVYIGEDFYHCWKYFNGTSIVLATTDKLSSDVISQKPLEQIADGSDKLSVRFRMVVRQYALDKAGYDFYQLLKKNTESLGSIFDAQPTEISGNLHALSASAPVVGYITASTVDSTILWITNAEVPLWKPSIDCSQNIHLNTHTDNVSEYLGDWLPYSSDMSGNVYLARRECVSCRLRGGSTHRPSYW